MTKLINVAFCALAMTSFGCTERSKSTESTTIKTPGGTTTINQTTEVKKTGDHKTGESQSTPK